MAGVVTYWLKRPGLSDCLAYIGTTPEDVAAAVKAEIEADEGLRPDDIGSLVIEAREITQEEIEKLPEFESW